MNKSIGMKKSMSCKGKAVEILARSDQSIKRLREKLLAKGYEAEEIDEVLQWLQEKHYLNEEEGCKRKFLYMYENSLYSIRQICFKLQQQGYEGSLIQKCIPEEYYDREYITALKVVKNKVFKDTSSKRIMQYLGNKGFDFSIGRRIAEDFCEEQEFI